MYTIKCDNYPLLDLRDDREELIVVNPKCKLEVNTVGEAGFTIYNKHPYYNKLKKLKSIFEIADEIGVIFRGRMTNDSLDFHNGKAVDLEGAMAFFNDSYIEPFNFPENFIEDEGYIASSNVVEFFLAWVISKHNSQVDDFQKFKLGNVTVADPNNYLSRSSENFTSTWEILKSKLFDSALGGYLCVRYEEDGNYVDYLSDFELTNTQDINFGENILDLVHKSDAQETYSCIIPIGAEIEETVSEADDSGETTVVKKKLTLESIADGEITDDIVKVGNRLYSKSAREAMGMICAPISDTTWEDVTEVQNLLTKSVEYLSGTAIKLIDTVEITAADLHFTDEEIRSFRIYRNINVNSEPHGIEAAFQLTKLEIDLLNPQNTKITVGETKLTLIDQNNKEQSDNVIKIEQAIKDIEENRSETTEIRNQVITQRTEIINTCTEIILAASEQYVETGEYDEFKQTVEAQLTILSDQISMNFTETTTQIENVNGDLQETNTTLSKYFDFTIDGLVIKSGESSITLHVDNDIIMFKRNGVMFGWWDGVDFHTGNIVVEVNERAQFGNFAFIPRSDGSLAFLKVDNEVLANKLIAISVTYSGGDVSVGTTLEELTGITVTAIYSDGSTEEVADYTLSGTIQEGSSTITVTYQEKTARFTVVGVANAGTVLGSATTCLAMSWMSETTYTVSVRYSEYVEVVDGEVTLVDEQKANFYMTTSENSSSNDYDVLRGKYVKAYTGDIYYIDPESTHTHAESSSQYFKESLVYNTAYLVSVAE